MNWNEFKEDAEATAGKPCKDLGICEVKMGCLKGKPYIEICPITSRVKTEDGVCGLILELTEEDIKQECIMELAENASEISQPENLRKALEKLLHERKANITAIKSLEVEE